MAKLRRISPKLRLIAAATLVAGLVAGAVLVVLVRFLLEPKSKSMEFCCSLDQQECTFNSYCDSNATSCLDCSGVWMEESKLGTVVNEADAAPTTSHAGLRTSAPTAIATGAARQPTPMSPMEPTAAPSLYPTFAAASGQACLDAAKDARAVTSQLQGLPGETILLERSTQLCTLWQVDSARTKIVPVGRSYHGHPWEPYGGKFNWIKFNCDPSRCSLTLPELPDGYSYELAAFDHELPERDVVARFLEQTTFGPTRKDLDGFDTSFAEWILTQQTQVPLSSHRQFFRERATFWRAGNPTATGITTQPCQAGARYRRYAFTEVDFFQQLQIQTDPLTDRKVFLRNGQAVTVLEGSVLTVQPRGNNALPVALEDGMYKICEVVPGIGEKFVIGVDGMGCLPILVDGEPLSAPEVFFDADTQPTWPLLNLDEYGQVVKITDQELYLKAELDDPKCLLIPNARFKDVPVVVAVLQGQYWIFDRQIQLEENTLDTPLPDGGGSLVIQTRLTEAELASDSRATNYEVACSNAHISFINIDFCELSYEPSACTPRDSSDVPVTLEADTLQKIYDASGAGMDGTRYLYAVQGLRQEASQVPYRPPCAAGSTSRWIPSECFTADAGIQPETNEAFRELISESTDDNSYMRDITFPLNGKSCDAEDKDKYGFLVNVAIGECWLNVHQSHLQVFDFTDWVNQHPGGKDAISTYSDGSLLDFPGWHGMDRWHGWSEGYRAEIGRLGDQVKFSELPSALTTKGIAMTLGAYEALQVTGPAVVCGTPNEVRNEPITAGPLLKGSLEGFGGGRDSDIPEQRKYVWFEMALKAEDQLRQRVAWILSQILVVSPNAGDSAVTEPWVSYYDIFVRHAFGNYRDILKEVSFSPMMATMLTFMGNKSTDYFWRIKKSIGFADENYAREVMQLFSIGLLKMNNDGTLELDENGKPIPTYTNDEIVEYARAWTGFHMSEMRGNIEGRFGTNKVDPLLLESSWRDSLPKLGLEGFYVGDGLPLCSDFPRKHFLQEGATYILLGSISRPLYHSEPDKWATYEDTVRTQLDTNSALYATLCDRDNQSGNCKYPPKVVLDSKLECFGDECGMDAPRLVEVESGILYEYVRMPCSHQAFFSDGHAIVKRLGFRKYFACGDSKTAIAQVGCCSQDGSGHLLSPTFGNFHGENIPWLAAKELCEEAGLEVCFKDHRDCSNCNWHDAYWVDHSCSQQVKISLDGRVGLVHSFQDTEASTFPSVSEETKTFFHVIWSSEANVDMPSLLSDYDDMCSLLGCRRDAFDGLCLCDTEVNEVLAFESPPSGQQVLEELFIGAVAPSIYWGPHPVFDVGGGVKMHSMDGLYSTESVFEVVDDNGVLQYRKNVRSDVVLGRSDGLRAMFRNPLHLQSIHSTDKRDILYETDAALDHYVYHKNTAPFLVQRFAQRFGLSNPTPHLIEAGAEAFRKGFFVDMETGVQFGSGVYGDLGAMVAALLLDRETRSVVLDADPSHGSLQEPLLRLVRVMRSLEFELKPENFFIKLKSNLHELIGQAPYESPTVFSFFLPEYKPQGPVGDGGLVCPECQVLAGPKVVDLLNGVLSLLKYGLDSRFGGFSSEHKWMVRDIDYEIGGHYYADGFNWYLPTEGLGGIEVVDELATLLTSGRLSREKRTLLQSVYESHSGPEAYINVQQLIATSPEFHTTGVSRTTGQARPEVEPPVPSSQPYKAVVHLLLNGGIDSFNILVPADCEGGNAAGQTVDEQYQLIRGEIGIKLSETTLRISVDPSLGQPCSSFAIHPQASVFKELYDEGSLAFFANVGSFNSIKMNKGNFRDFASVNLFSHNGMQEEVKALDPHQQEAGTGILGRMINALNAKGISAAGVSINQYSSSLDGLANSRVVSQNGSTRFNDRPVEENNFDLFDFASELNGEPEPYSSLFGKTWSSVFTSGVTDADFLADALDKTTLESSQIDSRFGTVARLMQTKDDRGVDRDLFHVENYDWDHHSNLKIGLAEKLNVLNKDLKLFVDQLKSQGMWENTVVVITSDFGRTLTPNGMEGSDHAWSGNYMVFGGGVRGGQILGQYPYDLTETGPVNLGYGRGRLMPTTAWESVWNGIVQWMGVETTEEIEYVLPNLNDVHGGGFFGPFSEADIFQSETNGI